MDTSAGGWGTIGIASPLRQLVPIFEGKLPSVSVCSPPPAYDVYRHYIDVDLSNPEFRRVFLNGLGHHRFAEKFIQLTGNYGYRNPSGPGGIATGREVIRALAEDHELQNASLIGAGLQREPFRIVDHEGRRETLRMLIVEASIQATNAMIVADEFGTIPVTDDPFFAQLLAVRLSNNSYMGGVSTKAPFLGFEIARAVIPDEVLMQLDISDILGYRERTREAYRLWSIEINRIAAESDRLTAEEIEQGIPRTIAAEIAPRLLEYRNEMRSTAERLFGNLLKVVGKWQVPSLSIAYIAKLGFSEAIAVFVATMSPAIPAVADFFQARRETRRKHAMAYLVDLAEEAHLHG